MTAEDAKSFGVEKMELDEIWPLADYVTVHTPLIPQTRSEFNIFFITEKFYEIKICLLPNTTITFRFN